MSKKHIPSSLTLISRLTIGNIVIISLMIGLSGFTVYQFACQLVGNLNGVNQVQQQTFNETFLYFVLAVLLISVLSGSVFYYLLLKKVLSPIQQLADSTEDLIKGDFPDIEMTHQENEINRLTRNFNALSVKLKSIEESRTRLVSEMAHELRTPLSNINGYLEGLKKGIIPGSPVLYDALHKEALRLINMVNDLYKLSEWEIEITDRKLKKEKVNMKELIDRSITLFRWDLLEKEIQISVEVEERDLQIDPYQMESVLINLVQNAIEHQECRSPIKIKGYTKRKDYHIEVETTGKTILPEEKDKIFDRYHQTESTEASSERKGIGLAIVKEVVEKHGGQVGLQTDGHRHSFWFDLPLE
ncbi:sensor histidine kinase [Alteribacillus iranensis]|uniref:sensor histidine kinase n=1 Tax=Alteribacillus iranensis TaxID=930128 RepID=UPI0011608E43|nr:HAMP domain-containing sensor histidine kinase [Alteribacillus iranensis]